MRRLALALPVPAAGLMLGLAVLGNLMAGYSLAWRVALGTLAAVLLVLLTVKWIIDPASVTRSFSDPLVAGVMFTYPMGVVILSAYIRPLVPGVAWLMWLCGIGGHLVMLAVFTRRYVLRFDIKNVYPSWFIAYVGVICGSVTAPAFGVEPVGRLLFWTGFAAYLVLLPLVTYRLVRHGGPGGLAVPALAIYAAPGSLALAGYLQSFPQKNPVLVGAIAALAGGVYLIVLAGMPRMLRAPFSPAYSAFTFPFVITAIALKGAAGFLEAAGGTTFSWLPLLAFVDWWAAVMVGYTVLCYSRFLLGALRRASAGQEQSETAPS